MKRVADEKVLVLDFGFAICPTDRPAGAAAAGLLRDRPARHHGRADPRAGPEGDHPFRRAGQRLRAGAPQCDPDIFQLGLPVLGICYGMQLACEALGGQVQGAPAREYGRAQCRVTQAERAVRRRARRDRRLDEPRRPGVAGLRRFPAAGRHRHLPVRRGEASRSCRSTACNSIPK